MEVTIDGIEELREEFQTAIKKYPCIAEEALLAAGKKFRNAVKKETRSATFTGTGNLLKGYKLDPVEGYGPYMHINFRATAPHFHLIENGHELVTHKTKNGKKLRNGGQNIGFVPGRLIVAAVRADYNESKFPEEMEKALEKLLKESNLL
ncbi:hypothetical protein C806_00070 [Lachnospiraceae bacterium 3-1]|nr:hypothetical protein C806_00070 [Lachnospiraceae bacterium 3-1]